MYLMCVSCFYNIGGTKVRKNRQMQMRPMPKALDIADSETDFADFESKETSWRSFCSSLLFERNVSEVVQPVHFGINRFLAIVDYS